VRQLADRAAQTLGYAVYRARAAGGDLDADSYARLGAALAAHEAEASRLEAQLAEVNRRDGGTVAPPNAPPNAPPDAPRPGQPGGQADESMPPVNPT